MSVNYRHAARSGPEIAATPRATSAGAFAVRGQEVEPLTYAEAVALLANYHGVSTHTIRRARCCRSCAARWGINGTGRAATITAAQHLAA